MKTPSLQIPLRSLAITAACTFLTASAFAQAPAPGAPAAPGAAPAAPATGAPAATPAPKLGPMEKTFIKNAAKSIYYQLQLANAAKTTVTDQNLSRYRDSTIRDMTKAWDAVSKLGTSRGETVAGELTPADKGDVDRLAKMKEDKFTKQWLEDLSKESKRLDKEFESAGKTLQDADVKMFAINYGAIVRGVFTGAEGAEKALAAAKKKP
jgi:hypothetical protein